MNAITFCLKTKLYNISFKTKTVMKLSTIQKYHRANKTIISLKRKMNKISQVSEFLYHQVSIGDQEIVKLKC